MADAGSLKGFAKSEVRLLARGDSRVLVSRLRAGGRLLVLALMALAALIVPALDLRLEPVGLICSRDQAACTVASGRAGTRTLPFSTVDRFTARQRRKQKPELVAETRQGEVVLVHRWPRIELSEHAEALNRLLRGEGPPRWAFLYDRRTNALREDLPIFGTIFLILCVVLATQLGWRTRLDRRGRSVVRWKPLSRSARPIGGFRAVRVRSMAEANPGQRGHGMDAVLDAHLQIALVEAGGAAWPITRFVTCPRDEVEARAAEVAAYLGLPVERPQPLATVLAPGG